MTRISNSNNNNKNNSKSIIKFLYSYGGQIMPRHTDGELRYVGGHTRVLAVDRSITYAELMVKFLESCGSSTNLRCKLPTEDLDVLVSITSDEDLAHVIEEYDRTDRDMKIRAILVPVQSIKTISPPDSPVWGASCYSNQQKPSPTQRPVAGYYSASRVLQHKFAAPKPPKYPVAGFYSLNPPSMTGYRNSSPAFGGYRGYEQQNLRRHVQLAQQWNHSH